MIKIIQNLLSPVVIFTNYCVGANFQNIDFLDFLKHSQTEIFPFRSLDFLPHLLDTVFRA